MSTPSDILSNASYVFGLAETSTSTAPGELLAAAVASSVSTIVSLKMAKLGVRPGAVEARAVIAVDDCGRGWRLCSLHLEIIAQVREPACDRLFYEAVAEARRDCPIVSVLNLDYLYGEARAAGCSDGSLSMTA